jgi:hypothetical protein
VPLKFVVCVKASYESATLPEEYTRPFPKVVVGAAYTFPAASTPRPEPESPVNHCVPTVSSVVEAFVDEAVSKAAVEEAKREMGEPVRRSAVEVAETDWPQKVACVKGSPEAALEVMQVLLTAKHPCWRLMPFPVKEEVAVPVTSKRKAVVVPSEVTFRYVPVEEPTAKESRAAAVETERVAYGEVVPTPTFPEPNTLKRVAFVVEATAKRETVPAVCVEVETESCEKGVVVPMPTAVVVADVSPPATAWVHASYVTKPEFVMVTGEVPKMSKPVQETPELQVAVVVARAWYIPPLPP